MIELRRVALTTAFVALLATPARADDASDLQGLLNQTVVTTASKAPETGADAPATSTTLTADDIRRYGIHTLADALDFLSLGMWTSNSLVTTDVGARGVMLASDRGSHLLLLIDGHAVSEPLFGTARFGRGAGVPMEMIDHVEVILGPGSVLYGTDAMNGVVNVITKRAKDMAGLHVVGEAEAYKSFDSWRVAAGAGYLLPFLSDSAELTVMLDYYTQTGPALDFPVVRLGVDPSSQAPFQFRPNGPRDSVWGGSATQSNTAQAPSGVMRLVSGPFEIETGAKAFKRAAPYDALDFDQNAYFDDPQQYQVDRQAWVDIKHHATLSTLVQTTARVYGDTYDYQRYADTAWGGGCLIYGSSVCRQYVLGASRWAGSEVQASFDWLKDASLVTLVGADGRLRYAASKTDLLDYATGKNIRSSVGAFSRDDQTLGAYAQQTWRPASIVGINAGARLDFDPRFQAEVSPRLAATVRAWQGGTLKAIYSEAFRAPTLGESYYSDPDQIPSQGLRPEKLRSAEASVEQRIGASRLFFGVFRSWWDDLIDLHPLSAAEVTQAEASGQIDITRRNLVSQYRNISSIDALGYNGGYEGASDDGALRYALNVTGVHATRSDPVGTYPLGAAPSVYGNARISYDLPGLWPTVALASRWLAARPADRAFDGASAVRYAPADLELRGTVTGDVPKVTGLLYRASASWAAATVAPYFVGPTSESAAQRQSQTTLLPADTFRVTVGLQYDFAQ